MAKSFYQDEKVIWKTTFYTDKERTTPVNPVTVELSLKKPDGTTADAVVTSGASTGQFEATYVVDQYGTWEWRWQTETPRIVGQGEINVIQRNVPE